MEIRVNDVTLYYEKQGTGAPLILLHGNGEDRSIFEALVLRLQSYFTIYAIDSRNHGKSSKTADYAYIMMAEDVRQFVVTLGLQGAFVVGFSDGAIVATMVQIRYPDTFGRMVLLGINLKPSDFKHENLVYLKDEYDRTKDPLVRLMLEQPNIETESLRAIKVPTLIVRAEDELFRDNLYTEIVSTMPHAQLLVMEGHSHDSYIVGNDVLSDYLMSFFN